MMDSERPQYQYRTSVANTSSSSNELLVCFASRLSSSSMKLSSKSMLSPGRTRDPPLSLSNSRSRRLRTNGSIKAAGQASPMFPRKRGCAAFENPEPSSPKVTCIGQVRVKTKKQDNQMRTLSRRRGSGEVSFRKTEQQSTHEGMINQSLPSKSNDEATNANNDHHQECLSQRNQRWAICEGLRAFGADQFSCLFPCLSQRGREEKAGKGRNGGENTSSCGAVFARWFVALQDGDGDGDGEDGGKGREIELVVGGGEEERRRELIKETTLRRHVVEEMEIRDEKCKMKEEGEEGRVSVCIPPKNALLLMRCRSDPMRMSALANRIWESALPQEEEGGGGGNEEEHANVEEDEIQGEFVMVDKENEVCEMWVSDEVYEKQEENQEAETNVVTEMQEEVEEEEEEEEEERENPHEKLDINEELLREGIQEKEEEEEEVHLEMTQILGEEENVLDSSFTEALVDQEAVKQEKEANLVQEEEEERRESDSCAVLSSRQSVSDDEAEPEFEASAEIEALEEETVEESTEEKETHERLLEEEDEEIVTQDRSKPEEDTKENYDKERETHDEKKEERESSVLPDCLVLMMCEPKLSMEVSKETWVCNTDFIRCLPQRLVNPKHGGDPPKKTTCNNIPTQQQLLPRSSCSLPAPPSAVASMAAMIEQKLMNAVAYEPLVLTRCQSAPMRTAAQVAPHAYFWKGRKLEPYRRATVGVGAAGVGF